MAYCNNCGRNISSNENIYKRELYSGVSRRTNYGKRITFGTSRHYTMKTVCSNCASQIDRQTANANKTFLIIIFGIAICVVLYFLVK